MKGSSDRLPGERPALSSPASRAGVPTRTGSSAGWDVAPA